MEIKHIHPEHPTEKERQEKLASVHRACVALVSAQRKKTERRQGKGA